MLDTCLCFVKFCFTYVFFIVTMLLFIIFFLLFLSSNHNDDNLLKSVFCNRFAAINNVWIAFANYVENWFLMLYYHLLCIVSAYLLILYISVSLSVLLPNVANKRVHCRRGVQNGMMTYPVFITSSKLALISGTQHKSLPHDNLCPPAIIKKPLKKHIL